jgi:hypothetical protein
MMMMILAKDYKYLDLAILARIDIYIDDYSY